MGSSTRSPKVSPLLPGGGLTSSTSSIPPPAGPPVPEAFGAIAVAGLDTRDTLAPGMLLHDGRVANPFEGASPAVGGSPRRLGSTCRHRVNIGLSLAHYIYTGTGMSPTSHYVVG